MFCRNFTNCENIAWLCGEGLKLPVRATRALKIWMVSNNENTFLKDSMATK